MRFDLSLDVGISMMLIVKLGSLLRYFAMYFNGELSSLLLGTSMTSCD
jgi:hypothetical protein